LSDVLDAQLKAFTVDGILRLRDGLAKLAKATDGRFAIGTGCSGTDVFVRVWRLLAETFETRFGIPLYIAHEYSIEKVDFKQAFIRDYHSPAHIFADMHAVAEALECDEPMQDLSTEMVSRLPPCTVWACGIECDSVSQLNNQRAANKACVSDSLRDTKTGNTARSCMAIMRACRPPLAILENVLSLWPCQGKKA
jgi:hypothetical protein